MSDEELIGKIAQGNEKAFDELYERYSNSIYGLSFNYTGNPTDAQELTQEVFVKVWRNARKFRGKSSVKTWIFKIAVNVAMDYFRGKKRIDYVEMPEEIEIKTQESLEFIALREALLKISPRERMALLLVYAEARSYKETSKIMGCSVKAVESLARRAKLKIRKILRK